MINRISSFGLASVALAAAAILNPAEAAANSLSKHHITKHHVTYKKAPFAKKKIVKVSTVKKGKFNHTFHKTKVHHKPIKAVKLNDYGQSFFTVKKRKQQALYACSYQLRHDAHKFGYKGARLAKADVKQVGKNTFIVHSGAKLFDGYEVNHKSYDCKVKHGKVVDVSKLKKLHF